ncbi:MAG: VWA domain-containing protein [bacterium]|nr:VWA domain-containing protein [bacterium]
MRKRLLLTAICVLSMAVAMAQNNRTNPDVADYFIKGYLSIERGSDGKPVYKLSDIQKRGISFDDPGAMMKGEETLDEDVMFEFTHYTTDYIGGITTPLDFWRYDETIHEWQPDVETRQGNASLQKKKSMVLMLVLDCSSSLQNDFSFVQEAAKSFIKSMLDASGKGNVKIGIVCFSKISETDFFPITSLTNDSYYDMCRFINSRNVQNGTALYYAMDKAIDVMESYCNNSIPAKEPLSAAMMVTFTDGLDQTSRDEEKGIYTADDYYIELQRKMKSKRFNGVPLQSKMRGVRGVDIATEAQLGKFSQIGNSLADFKLLNNVSELGQEFQGIAKSLIDEWAVLNCFVPNSFKGRVAWTYPSKKQVVAEKPKEPRKRGRWFVGLNAGLGISNYYQNKVNYYQREYGGSVYSYTRYDDYLGLAFSGGFDIAFPIGRAANLGLFSSVGFETADNTLLLSAGPLLLINFRNGSSLYLGGGMSSAYFDSFGTDWRVGFKFNNGLYLFAELLSISDSWSYEDSFYIIDGYNYNYYTGYEEYGHYVYFTNTEERSLTGFLFHIGYSF